MQPKSIKGIQFGIWAPDEIRDYSVLHVTLPVTYDQSLPTPGGLFDPKLGTINKYITCGTCEQKMDTCTGHFGHVELARPVYHPGLINDVMKMLRCVCHSCAGVLMDKEYIKEKHYRWISKATTDSNKWYKCDKCKPDEEDEENDEDQESARKSSRKTTSSRSKTSSRLSTRKRAKRNGARQNKYLREGILIYGEKIKDKTKKATVPISDDKKDVVDKKDRHQIVTPLYAYNILERVTTEDAEWLGFKFGNRPENFIITVLPVPPPAVRPSVQMDSSRRGEDDLTYKLTEIIRANNNLREQMETESTGGPKQDHWSLLQFHVATYLDNDIPKLAKAKHRSGRDTKGFKQRLKSKEGRIRTNLMGKRVDFSARDVITPDPYISINDVGVPLSIAMNLTYKVSVNKSNIDWCYELVRNGPYKYPGANFIMKKTGRGRQIFDLSITKNPMSLNLRYGDIVVRHLQDGDYVFFNRQPSLHRMSMMGHRVKVLPGDTFRLSVSVTPPYNADFDGDEMNMHVMQSEDTRAEAEGLCLVEKNMISPKNSNPVIGLVQGGLLAAYLLSQRDKFITKFDLMDLLMCFKDGDIPDIPEPAIMKPIELWTGKQLISIILPDINMYPNKFTFERADETLYIRGGEFLSGVLAKKHMGPSTGSILHIIRNDKGDRVAGQFLDTMKFTLNEWMKGHGFSVGIGDAYMDDKDKKIETQINNIISGIESGVEQYIATHTHLDLEQLEKGINDMLNKVVGDVGELVLKHLRKDNNFMQMVISGSKGNENNIGQIIGLLGGQNVAGKRIGFGYHRRTLPHFDYNDQGAQSRGFVFNSYKKGLTPQEYFFHAMGGREGLVDTAIKTGEVGYISRKLMKAMEDLGVQYDKTVRNSLGEVVQVMYGEDDVDSCCLEIQTIESVVLGYPKFLKEYKYTPEQLEKYIGAYKECTVLLDEAFDQLLEDRRFLSELHTKANGLYCSEQFGMLYLSVNIDRVIKNALQKFRTSSSVVHPVFVLREVDRLETQLEELRGHRLMQLQPQSLKNFMIAVRSKLSPKQITHKYKLSAQALQWICKTTFDTFAKHLVQPGEMVGSIAAESLGEPTQQMTLNTFHSAGMSKANVTLGVPRVKEIIHAVQRPKAPTMHVYLDPDISKDADKVLEMRMNIQGTKIKDVIVSDETSVFYEKNTFLPPFPTQFEEDSPWVRLFYTIMFNGATDPTIFSHNIIRLVFDKTKLQKRGLTVNAIATHLNQLLGEEMLILSSDVNYSKPVIRLRLIYDKPPTNDDDRKIEATFLKQYLRQHLKEFVLCGAPNIENCFVESHNAQKYNKVTNEMETKEEWFLLTEGTDLKKILNWEGVDHTRTISNNPTEILSVLGIEATRQSIIFEIEKVMKFYGIRVNYRNMSLLADTMTGRGSIMAINRHGINRTDASPLKKCTFEETVDMLLDAGKDAVYDNLNAVSSNIIVGKLARLGTGMFQLKWDNDANRKYSTPRDATSKWKKIQHEQRKERRQTSLVSPARENVFGSSNFERCKAESLSNIEDALKGIDIKGIDTSDLFGDIANF